MELLFLANHCSQALETKHWPIEKCLWAIQQTPFYMDHFARDRPTLILTVTQSLRILGQPAFVLNLNGKDEEVPRPVVDWSPDNFQTHAMNLFWETCLCRRRLSFVQWGYLLGLHWPHARRTDSTQRAKNMMLHAWIRAHMAWVDAVECELGTENTKPVHDFVRAQCVDGVGSSLDAAFKKFLMRLVLPMPLTVFSNEWVRHDVKLQKQRFAERFLHFQADTKCAPPPPDDERNHHTVDSLNERWCLPPRWAFDPRFPGFEDAQDAERCKEAPRVTKVPARRAAILNNIESVVHGLFTEGNQKNIIVPVCAARIQELIRTPNSPLADAAVLFLFGQWVQRKCGVPFFANHLTLSFDFALQREFPRPHIVQFLGDWLVLPPKPHMTINRDPVPARLFSDARSALWSWVQHLPRVKARMRPGAAASHKSAEWRQWVEFFKRDSD